MQLVLLYKILFTGLQSRPSGRISHIFLVLLEVVKRAHLVRKILRNNSQTLQIKQQHAPPKTALVGKADFAYLFKSGIGELKLPDDALRKETLMPLKDIARCYLRKP